MEKDKSFDEIKIGDKDKNGDIVTDIYFQTENYLFYEIRKDGRVNFWNDNKKDYSSKVVGIKPLIIEFNSFLTTKRVRRKNAQIIADAQNTCLNYGIKAAKKILKKEIKIKRKNRIVDNRIKYLMTCFFAVILVGIIAFILRTLIIRSPELQLENIRFLAYIALFGSFGGMISIVIKVKEMNVELFNNSNNQFLFGLSRIGFAMISSIIVYALIRSNIIFGFIYSLDNQYIMYSMAAVAGFSEYFIPNVLKSAGKKNE